MKLLSLESSKGNWIALLFYGRVFWMMCPGKVLKLMAGDVAEWHKSERRGLHPDTRVWAKLMPWQVLKGKEKCTRSYIVKICEEENVHPCWVTPKPQKVPFLSHQHQNLCMALQYQNLRRFCQRYSALRLFGELVEQTGSGWGSSVVERLALDRCSS